MKLIKAILEQIPNNIFTLAEANTYGLTRYYIKKMVEEGILLEVEKGVFQKEGNFENGHLISFKAATVKLKERSAICLWSALSFYGLTDEVPSKVWCILPYPYGVSSVKCIRLKDPKWDIGIDKHDGFEITSIERTIVDCFLSSKYVPVSESFNALKKAITTKKTSVSKILSIANSLNSKDKILPFLEIAS
ncbi:MAG: hypothetical protein CMJ16_03150 [Peredibacter sp.]|nr:hypothetical protein [Peredibacter sp.]